MHNASRDERVGLAVVGFSPADRLGAVTRQLGWTGLVLSDPTRRLYRRLGIGRAPWWRVYSPGTLARYARAVAAHHPLARSDEDTRQMGGDALMVDGAVIIVWRPRTPSDRPPATEVLAVASAAARRLG